jgi:hypothetical protein
VQLHPGLICTLELQKTLDQDTLTMPHLIRQNTISKEAAQIGLEGIHRTFGMLAQYMLFCNQYNKQS